MTDFLTTLWIDLLSLGVTRSELCTLLEHAPQLLDRAWNELMPQGPTKADLRRLCEVPTVRERAAKRLLTETPSDTDLTFIVRWVPEVRDAAWAMLSQRRVSNDDLREILNYVPALGKQSARKMLANQPDSVDLRLIIEQVPELATEAQELLAFAEKRKRLIGIICRAVK